MRASVTKFWANPVIGASPLGQVVEAACTDVETKIATINVLSFIIPYP